MTRPAEAAPPLPPLPADPNEFWRNLAYGIGGAFGSGQLPGLNPLSLATQATSPANRQALLDLPVVGGVAQQAELGGGLGSPITDPGALGVTGALGGIPRVVMPPLALALGTRAAGELKAAGPAAARGLARAAEVQPPAEAGGVRGFIGSEGGAVPIPEESQVTGGLANRIGAKGSLGVPEEGAGPAQTAEQRAGVKAPEATSVAPASTTGFVEAFGSAKNAATDSFVRDAWARLSRGKRLLFSDKPGTLENRIQQAADAGLIKTEGDVRTMLATTVTTDEGATVPSPRYAPVVGNSRSYVRDTVANEDLPQIFGGKDHAEKAVADANARNGVQIAETNAKIASEAVVPTDHPIRKLTTDQLGALRRVATDPADKAAIDALLGERAFTVAPDAKLAAALGQVPKDIHAQVRRALRTDVGADLTPKDLAAVPGMRQVLDSALGAAKADVNLANRNGLAQQLIDKAGSDNVANLARNAKKPTGIPAVDKANEALAHADGDARAGVAPTQVFEDATAAIRDVLSEPEQLQFSATPTAVAGRAAETLSATPRVAPEVPTVEGLQTAGGRGGYRGPQPVVEEGVRSVESAAAAEPRQLDLEPATTGSDGGPKVPPITPVAASTPPFGERARKFAGDLLNVGLDLFQASRNIASGDVSSLASQTFPMLFKTPGAFIKGNLEGLTTLFKNETAFKTQMANLQLAVEREGLSVGNAHGQLFFREVGTNIQRGEERFAGLQTVRDLVDHVLERVPALKIPSAPVRLGLQYLKQTEQEFAGSINSVATYGLLAQIRGLEWLYRRPLTLAEKQGLADNINILLGRGYNLKRAGADPEMLVAISKIANGLGFSPQQSFARARLLPEAAWRVARVFNDVAHRQAPRPQDLDYIHGAGAFIASTLTTMALFNKLTGSQSVLDSGNTNFLKTDLGPESRELGAVTTALEMAGFRTQTYNGHVYLDPGQGVGQDMRLLTQLIGPFFGHLPSNSQGHAWNPYDAKGTDPSAMQLLVRFAENRLHPAAGVVASGLEGRKIDLADPTQNPVTSLLIPMALQSGLSASGLVNPGGPLRLSNLPIPGASLLNNLSASDVEKRRLAIDIKPAPGMDALSPERQKQFSDKVSAAVNARVTALMQTPKYQAATDAEKKDLITTNTSAVNRDTKRTLAIQIATTGTPAETVPAMAIALSESPNNLQKGQALAALQAANRLTPDVTKSVDALRKQTDRAKPSYDPTVAELSGAKTLADRWLAAPEFIIGTKPEWDLAAATAAKLRLLRDDAARRKVDPREDEQIVKFYEEQGGPLFTQLYTFAGAKRPNAVHETRRDIQQDPLWGLVASSANRLDHPQVAP